MVFPVDKQQQQQQQQQQLKGVRTHISPRTAAIFRLHLISRTFSYLHLISRTFFYQNDTFFKEIQEFTIDSNPKGVNQAPSIRIRCRHIFRVFSTSYEKRFSIKMTLSSKRFKNLLSIRTRRGEIKRPLSESAVDTFFVFSRHLMKFFKKIINFLKNPSIFKKSINFF